MSYAGWHAPRGHEKIGEVCVVTEGAYLFGVFDSEQHAREVYGELTEGVMPPKFDVVPLFTVRTQHQLCPLEHYKGVKCTNQERGCSW